MTKADWVTSHKVLHAKGWATPHWPKEWGGTGWGPILTYIFNEELQAAGVPQPLPFNVAMCGPVLMQFGTDAQKARFLPRMASLDDWWCQGFSEPGAGSDLASLKTSARRDGDAYIVNGQKTWTTLAQHADWICFLARTDTSAKKQLGISFLLADTRSPGITVRPIQTSTAAARSTRCSSTACACRPKNLVGEENRGWGCAKFLLGNERVGIARVGLSKQRVARVKELAARAMADTASDSPLQCRSKVSSIIGSNLVA